MTESPREPHVLAILALLGLTILGFFHFPGHTYLQSDTHIYLPMMERLLNPQLLANDIIAVHPHLSYTLYDEVATGFKWLTGLDFEPILYTQQFIARFLGMLGIYLLALAARLRPGAAVFVCGLFSLGTFIVGPAVLTIEYEPVPRGTAIPLLLLSIGLAAHSRWTGAALAAGAAFLYHPPTVWPVWLLLIGYLAWSRSAVDATVRRRALVIFAGTVVFLLIASRFQIGEREKQQFLAQIPPDLEELQRMRASYNWIGIWIERWWVHYSILLVLALGAWWRIRDELNGISRLLLAGLPVLGALSLPLSYLLLDIGKWIVIPQAQPGRALLWVTVCAILNAGLAAAILARRNRSWEALAWLAIPFALPVHLRFQELAWPDTSLLATRLALAVGLAALAAWLLRDRPQPFAVVAVLVAIFAFPTLGQVKNYADLHNEDLDSLSAWARQSTPVNAVFHFPDAGTQLYPGVFRSRALRAVWVDYKGGGQVNFTYSLAKEWWRRYSSTLKQPYEAWAVERYRELPADYLVLQAKHKRDDMEPVFHNSKYFVYQLRP